MDLEGGGDSGLMMCARAIFFQSGNLVRFV